MSLNAAGIFLLVLSVIILLFHLPKAFLLFSAKKRSAEERSYLLKSLCQSMVRSGRRKKFLRQFLPVLNQIANMIRAGSSIEEAFVTIGKENPDPIGEEFRLTMAEYNVTRELAPCIKGLASRIGSKELDLFANSIIISKRTGANLVEQIENIQKTLTDRFYIEGKVRSLTVQAKIQGIFSSVIPPVLIVVINMIDNTYFEPLFRTKLGNLIMVSAGALNAIGLLLMMKLSKIRF